MLRNWYKEAKGQCWVPQPFKVRHCSHWYRVQEIPTVRFLTKTTSHPFQPDGQPKDNWILTCFIEVYSKYKSTKYSPSQPPSVFQIFSTISPPSPPFSPKYTLTHTHKHTHNLHEHTQWQTNTPNYLHTLTPTSTQRHWQTDKTLQSTQPYKLKWFFIWTKVVDSAVTNWTFTRHI